jgi:hypothetical protein
MAITVAQMYRADHRKRKAMLCNTFILFTLYKTWQVGNKKLKFRDICSKIVYYVIRSKN